MAKTFFDTPIEFLKGVGPQRAEMLNKELGIFTFGDLLHHFPFRYMDRSRFYKINEINPDTPYVQLNGTFTHFETVGEKRKQRLVGAFTDGSGTIETVWFKGIKWIREKLNINTQYIVFGKPSLFKGKINIVHPEVESVSDETLSESSGLQAIYSSSEKLKTRGLDSRGIARLQRTLSQLMPPEFPETLSNAIIKDLRLLSRREAFHEIHTPKEENLLKKAQFRLKFEELFYIQLRLIRIKMLRLEKLNGHRFINIGSFFNTFYHQKLPFELTGAQKKVLKEIRQDVGSGKQMNRLLQGDVGSGKTLVAFMSILMALDNNTQACLMAPTEILANQHFENIIKLVDGLGIHMELLTGSTKARKRKQILEQLVKGDIHLLTGTHALLEANVQFKNLGLVIVDEQHRFGVKQRAKLWKKNKKPPHVLVMTATPIPRTLAMTLYGDLDVSVIDELPPGRRPVKTIHRYDSSRLRVFGFIKEQIALGRQVYIVYPLIEESEKMDYKDLMDGFEGISRAFPLPRYKVSIVHGKMKPADKNMEMQRFVKGETNIMVATTVIEVGVDVPNASVMIIESAERFGLSQLHQLRGRVGRGADQSYCILMTSHKLSNDAKIRIETMVKSNDGFEISETDLRLRGPGDITGTRQSGLLELHIADISKDTQILQLARKAAISLLEIDTHLRNTENLNIRNRMIELNKDSPNWSRIS